MKKILKRENFKIMKIVNMKKNLENQGFNVHMEQMRGVKPPSQPWQGRILVVEPHLQVS